MMKNFGLLPLFLLLILSCNNDIDKNITTDLQVEGKEIFNAGLALDESLYYAFLTFDQYKINKDTLPGCPTVTVDETAKKVTLTFSDNPDCPSQKLNRKGKISLQFINVNTLETNVAMEYNNYSFQSLQIEGTRKFKQIKSLSNVNRRTETFTDLLIIDQFDSSTKISGNFEHQLKYFGGALSEFISAGSVEGRNITGRKIIMGQLKAKNYKVSCIKQGIVMPTTGTNKWDIFRTGNLSVSHTVNYNQESDCKSEAKISLSDGRTLVFSQ